MKHRTNVAYAFLPIVIGFGILGYSTVSAQGWFGGMNTLTPDEIATRQQTMFQNEAQLLGISVDDVKNAWAQGKTLSQLAQDKGITADQLQTKLKDAATQRMRTQMQTLIDKGVITQTQADQRLQYMQNKMQSTKGMMMGKRMYRGILF
jgi:hypothetical protein